MSTRLSQCCYSRHDGRVSPNEEDMDLEYWWQNLRDDVQRTGPVFAIDTTDRIRKEVRSHGL
jgi:hypothetical protein